MNFYPHHIGDFNNSTRHLTRVERSVYRDAIELYYDTESALIKDIIKLERKLMCSSLEEKEALKYIKLEFFHETEDGLIHDRCDAEIAKYRANIGAKAKAGIASAKARKEKRTHLKQKPTRVNVCSTPAHNQEPVTNNQLKESKPKKTASRFSTPSESDIQRYESEKGLNLTGFHDYYESNGWRVGRNPMKDWRASARGWSKRQVTNRQSNETNQRTPKNKTEQFYETLQAIHERSVDN